MIRPIIIVTRVLQYLTITYPDISYAVQQVCLQMHDLREPYLHLVKRILRYLKVTLDHGLNSLLLCRLGQVP